MKSKTRASAVLMALILSVSLLAGLSIPCAAEDDGYASAEVVQSNGTENWPKLYDKNSDYFCVMDAETGAILGEKGMDVETPPASLTKIMTCLVAIENGDLDAQVEMTEESVAYATDGSSNLYTQVGEVFTLRDMLYGMMLKSANDISTAIAIAVGGTLDHFLEMMNEKAEDLGCTHTYFANACGMPNEAHHSSAHDLALISQEALDSELFREIVHTKQYTIPATNMNDARTFENHHKFLVTDEYAYDGIIGGKTGYTDLAGSCLATYVERDGRTVIVIALHCLGMDNCLVDTKNLCDYGLERFENVKIPDVKGEIVEGGKVTIPSDGGISECNVTSSSDTLSDGTVRTRDRYDWHGRGVGYVVADVAPVVSSAASAGESGDPSYEGGAEAKSSVSAGTAAAAGNGAAMSGDVSRADSTSGMVNVVLIIAGVMLVLIIILVAVNLRLQRVRREKIEAIKARRRRQNEERNKEQDTGKDADKERDGDIERDVPEDKNKGTDKAADRGADKAADEGADKGIDKGADQEKDIE